MLLRAITLVVALSVPLLHAATTDVAYVWKSGDLFRFDYLKSVTVIQSDEKGKPEERRSELAAVLILEIKSATAGGVVSGTMRFDSPRVTLPLIRTFSSQADAAELQSDKNKTIAKAMEGAIKTARWNVNLSSDGSIAITSRTPANLNDWLKETSNAAGWRKKMTEQLGKLIEQDLGLKVPSIDHEIFACPSALLIQPANDGESLHPQRTEFTAASKPNDKLQLGFVRKLAGKLDASFVVPNLVSTQDVKMTPLGATTQEAVGVFDHKMGMLDTLNEDYSVKMKYQFGRDSIEQDVRVQYHLKRLAPAIARVD